MRMLEPSFRGWSFALRLFLTGLILGSCISSNTYATPNDGVPASLVGVHHLGPDYLIYRFYINKIIGDNVGEGGGGGSRVCCITLPQKWQPSLTVDLRWAVDHIVRSTKPGVPETAEVEGIYQAQVPVEKYTKPGNFYVHFFPNGHARIVVTSISSHSENHPIRFNDVHAIETATKGNKIKALFNATETQERRKATDDAIKEFGGWR